MGINEMGKEFHRGDIADFVWTYGDKTEKIQNRRNMLSEAMPYKVIILDAVDENDYLVAVCKEQKKKTLLRVKTNVSPLFTNVLTFYKVDSDCLRPCNDIAMQEDGSLIVEKIYYLHNQYIEERIREQAAENEQRKRQEKINRELGEQRKRKRLKKRFKKAMNEQGNTYKEQYEKAVLNNNKEAVREIEKKAGRSLEEKGESRSFRTKNGKVLYSNFNPHPCSGGRFTPK